MASKYHGLPDIDTAPDVFETSDEPESVLRPNDNGFGDEDVIIKPKSDLIDGANLPARRQAEKLFGRGTRRANPSLSFRPTLPILHRRLSDSSDEGLVTKESAAVRLRRLKAELAEVEKELAASSSTAASVRADMGEGEVGKRRSVLPPREPLDLMGEVAGLRQRLVAVEVGDGPAESREEGWKGKLERLTQPGPSTSTTPPETGPAKEVGLSEIDKRLAALEDLIGPTDETFENTSSPLTTTLNKHDHLLSVLTQPRHLDAISRRVKLLLVDLDRAAAAARRHGPSSTLSQPSDKTVTLSTADYTSLQTLFNLLPRLDPLIPLVPPLLARLRSLADLHASAGQVADGLARLQETQRKDDTDVKELKDVIEGVQRGLDESGKTILSNWEGLESRMKDLEERVKKLNE